MIFGCISRPSFKYNRSNPALDFRLSEFFDFIIRQANTTNSKMYQSSAGNSFVIGNGVFDSPDTEQDGVGIRGHNTDPNPAFGVDLGILSARLIG